ncbi:MAG: hypothetical protein DMG81_13270 [Acidobacteria bacterium]|nr:MAG: hypothetical protein DMG81_13270 [Acidobacteriota bacterium]
MGGRHADGFHAARGEAICSGCRETSSQHQETHRCGTPGKSILGVTWLLPFSRRSGIRRISSALREGTDSVVRVPNEPAAFPSNFADSKQILLEKQTLDIFESQHAGTLLERLPRNAEFVVFGVVTEYCVRLAAKGLLERGRKVSVVEDAIETLNPEEGHRTLAELRALGAKFTTTAQVVARLG